METPDERLFAADLRSAEFRVGETNGSWGLPAAEHPAPAVKWPQVILWMTAPPRSSAPDRYYVLLNLAGYRSASPTGSMVAMLEITPKNPQRVR
jgi:hypothetical protein